MIDKKKLNLYCFSPLAMFSTFLIEIAGALYIMLRYQMDTTAKIIIAMLGGLATFQLAEYMVCEGAFYFTSLDWARLGYAAITILPPLGMHLALTIAKKKNDYLLYGAYGSAAIFVILFLFIGHGMQAEQCLGNYVIFQIAPYASLPFAAFYYLWLVITIIFSWHAKKRITNEKRKSALNWLIIGYLSFMGPTMIVYLINPETINGIPSIMCGFAVFMALSLIVKVAPLVLHEKQIQTAK